LASELAIDNRQQKLALIREIVQQPCKITTLFLGLLKEGEKGSLLRKVDCGTCSGFETNEQDIFGNEELVGVSCSIRAGSWAKYFLNEEGRRDLNAFFSTTT